MSSCAREFCTVLIVFDMKITTLLLVIIPIYTIFLTVSITGFKRTAAHAFLSITAIVLVIIVMVKKLTSPKSMKIAVCKSLYGSVFIKLENRNRLVADF